MTSSRGIGRSYPKTEVVMADIERSSDNFAEHDAVKPGNADALSTILAERDLLRKVVGEHRISIWRASREQGDLSNRLTKALQQGFEYRQLANAKVWDLEAEVERLREELGDVETDLDHTTLRWAASVKREERLWEELALRDDSLANRRVRDLRAEVERLRGAFVELDEMDYYELSRAACGIIQRALGGDDGYRTVSSEARVRRSTLMVHYLAEIVCDHDREVDQPRCACSLVNLGWHPSVGEAVDAWIEHVLESDRG